MRRAQDMIGLPVILLEAGKQIGTVKDVVMDKSWTLQWILLEEKHWFAPSRCIRCGDVRSFGPDAVTIETEDAVQLREPSPDDVCLMNGAWKLRGMPMITVNGHQLGMIEDVYLSDQLGTQIVGYELSEGLISDLKEGRKWLPLPTEATLGEDAVIVPVRSTVEQSPII